MRPQKALPDTRGVPVDGVFVEGLGAVEAQVVHCLAFPNSVDPDVRLYNRAVLAQELEVELQRKRRKGHGWLLDFPAIAFSAPLVCVQSGTRAIAT